MLTPRRENSLARILAVRMAATSFVVLAVLTFLYVLRDVSNGQRLREATLEANAVTIARTLTARRNPAELPLYRDYRQDYGFRVFDRRALASRRVLASANIRWLPAVQHPTSPTDPGGDRNLTAGAADLTEGFTLSLTDPLGRHPPTPGSLLIRRVGHAGHHYWVQTYMIRDPAWARADVILQDLSNHVLIPALFFIPALGLAIFLTTQGALRPLRQLTDSAKRVGAAVARGQSFAPVPESGMAKEFSQVAATINAILAKLDHSLHLQKQFTSDVAHELRTPLAVLLLEISQIPDESIQHRLKTDINALSQLVTELLRFAQAEDVMDGGVTEVDVVHIVRKVIEETAAEAVVKHQMIELYCTETSSVIRGNSALIEIAVRNLINNALKYAPPQSLITVRAEAGPIVIVEDCGPGIPAEHRDHVFERFWRIDGQSGNGAGVGLALVRRIAQLHDGDVRLEDRQGPGTRFVLSLARSALASQPSREVSSPPRRRRPAIVSAPV